MSWPAAVAAAAVALAAALVVAPQPDAGAPRRPAAGPAAGAFVRHASPVSDETATLARIRALACGSGAVRAAVSAGGVAGCEGTRWLAPVPLAATASAAPASAAPVAPAALPGDGTLIARQRLVTLGAVGVDLVVYLSSGLLVTGVLCFPDDGLAHATVLHVHGGFGGIFVHPDGGDILGSCVSWAADHGRTAFVPSFRGQDGGQGRPELCLGEADDVAAAAILVRTLPVTDPDRLALVGGSVGACVVLKASVRIPHLRAAVAIAPPTDFAAWVAYHRTAYVPATETRCDGSFLAWDQGGPVFADTIDDIVCGHAQCSEAEYAIRSPILDVASATHPTLVIAAGGDNLVPPVQQVLWSALRNGLGSGVALEVRDRCSDVAALPLARDVLLYVPGAFHLHEAPIVVSGLLYLTQLLDAPGAGI